MLEDRTVPSATVNFAAVQTYSSGLSGPSSVTSGDFNNDGHTDLAVTNYSNATVAVLLGNGNGNFVLAGTFDSGGSSASITVGDFNNDGNADLGVVNSGLSGQQSKVGVLLGDGTGGFAPLVTFASGGSGAVSITVGDFNNDGNADLAVANQFANEFGDNGGNVGVLLGNGTGGFAPAVSFGGGTARPYAVAVGDFNNDGNADLAVANLGANTVGVLMGNGGGGFAATTFASGGSGTRSISVGDFNNDGNADLAVVHYQANTVGVLLGNGGGGFAPAATFASGGTTPLSVEVADFNSDGNTDLVVVNLNSRNLGVLLGNGVGSFAGAKTFASGGFTPGFVAVGDFNNDGQSDLAVINGGSSTVGILVNTTMNTPPVNTISGDQVAAEDVALVISGLSVFDYDTAGILTVTFSVTYGTLTVSDSVAGGVTAADISGNGTATLTLEGTQAQINATLAAATGLTYLGNQNFSGVDTLWMTTTDAGAGRLTDTDAITIEVLSSQQQTELLVALIADLGDNGVLNGGQESALVKTLSRLMGSGGSTRTFINQVNAFVAAGILTQEEADALIASAESIVASMQ
jgi:hypothetical protein